MHFVGRFVANKPRARTVGVQLPRVDCNVALPVDNGFNASLRLASICRYRAQSRTCSFHAMERISPAIKFARRQCCLPLSKRAAVWMLGLPLSASGIGLGLLLDLTRRQRALTRANSSPPGPCTVPGLFASGTRNPGARQPLFSNRVAAASLRPSGRRSWSKPSAALLGKRAHDVKEPTGRKEWPRQNV
jgi:hypothetical protein